MKKFTSKLIVTAVLASMLTATPAFASTSAPNVSRLSGLDRYQTANAIANEGWDSASSAILAYGENYPDALASVAYAKALGAPILLTGKDAVPAETMKVLKDKGIQNIFIVGGEGVVAKSVEQQLKDANYMVHVTRLAGVDRYETSVRIAEKLGAQVTKLVIATGDDYADALSIGAVAGIEGMPIILVPKDSVPASVTAYLAKHTKIQKTYVVGGTDIISADVANQFPSSERIEGADKYQRNVNILNKFASDFTGDGVCVATGENFADALTGTAYAAQNNLPILLLPNGTNIATSNYLSSKALNKLVAFGGQGVVSNDKIKGYCPDVVFNDTPSTTPTVPLTSTPTPTPTPGGLRYGNMSDPVFNLPETFWINDKEVKFTDMQTVPLSLGTAWTHPITDYVSATGLTYKVIDANSFEITYKSDKYLVKVAERELYKNSQKLNFEMGVKIQNGVPYISAYSVARGLVCYDPDNSMYYLHDNDPLINMQHVISPELSGKLDMTTIMGQMYAKAPQDFYLSKTSLLPDEIAPMKAKVDEITSGMSNDMDKFKAISQWVSANVYYPDEISASYIKKFSGSAGYKTFASHVGGCTEYAVLTGNMLELVGIPSRILFGNDHLWTQGYVNGQWVTTDATWDSGNTMQNGQFIKGQTSTKYLTSQPQFNPESTIINY